MYSIFLQTAKVVLIKCIKTSVIFPQKHTVCDTYEYKVINPIIDGLFQSYVQYTIYENVEYPISYVTIHIQ